MSKPQETFDRRAFVSRFMAECGLTYHQACAAHAAMCHAFEEAVISGSKITIGRVGSITPRWRPPREIQMHFRRQGKWIERGMTRSYFLDGRFDYRFQLYRQFMATRRLKWMLDMPISAPLVTRERPNNS